MLSALNNMELRHYTFKQVINLKKQTSLPRGTFKNGDKHPWLPGLYYREYGDEKEIWTQNPNASRRVSPRKQKPLTQELRDRKREYNKKYQRENREQIAAQSKRRWEVNGKDYLKKRQERHGAKLAAEASEKRAAKHSDIKELSPNENLMVNHYYKSCNRLNKIFGGTVWHVDHTVPLSLGGKHHPSNLQVVPAKWNLKKNKFHSKEWEVPFV